MTRILVTTWRRQGRTFGPVLRDMHGAEVQYVHAVQRAGGTVYLTPEDPFNADPDATMRGFDGLMLIGGEDLAAEVSGVAPETVGANASAPRDRWEIALLDAALRHDLPVLAVCRGLQLLNVACGGTLKGEIADSSPEHPRVPAELEQALSFRHPVEIAPDSVLARTYGTLRHEVNSLHHQAIDVLGERLAVTAHAPDGVVEAVEHTSARWCVGVQWHPELLPGDPLDQALFSEFVRATAGLSVLAVATDGRERC